MPPREASITLDSEVRHSLVFNAEANNASNADFQMWRDQTGYATCLELSELVATAPPAPKRLAAASAPRPAPGPASVAPSASTPAGPTPLSRRTVAFEVEGGRIEVWQNLRPRRTADWGVLVRHPSFGPKPVMIHSGNDEAAAQRAAVKARDDLRRNNAFD